MYIPLDRMGEFKFPIFNILFVIFFILNQSDRYGQCGTGNKIEVIKPTFILNNKKIKSIVLGYFTSFLLESKIIALIFINHKMTLKSKTIRGWRSLWMW